MKINLAVCEVSAILDRVSMTLISTQSSNQFRHDGSDYRWLDSTRPFVKMSRLEMSMFRVSCHRIIPAVFPVCMQNMETEVWSPVFGLTFFSNAPKKWISLPFSSNVLVADAQRIFYRAVIRRKNTLSSPICYSLHCFFNINENDNWRIHLFPNIASWRIWCKYKVPEILCVPRTETPL